MKESYLIEADGVGYRYPNGHRALADISPVSYTHLTLPTN